MVNRTAGSDVAAVEEALRKSPEIKTSRSGTGQGDPSAAVHYGNRGSSMESRVNYSVTLNEAVSNEKQQ